MTGLTAVQLEQTCQSLSCLLVITVNALMTGSRSSGSLRSGQSQQSHDGLVFVEHCTCCNVPTSRHDYSLLVSLDLGLRYGVLMRECL